MSDPINPDHYKTHLSGVECITISEHMNFCLGNAMKYLWRAGLKGDAVEDLKKARWYISRELFRLAAEDDPAANTPVKNAATWGTGWDNYLTFVNSTWVEEQLDENAHAGFGLVEEAGEVAGIMKRLYRGDGGLYDTNLKKELGDVIHYWTKICDLYRLRPEDVIAANVEKITDRKERGQLRGSGGDR